MARRNRKVSRERLTYKEWLAKGFQVQKGEKSEFRNDNGEAVFTRTQVKEQEERDHDWEQDDYNQWYDSYGYTRDWA